MASEVKLKAGWLVRDVNKAAERLHQWSDREATAARTQPKGGSESRDTTSGAKTNNRKQSESR